MRRKLVLAGFVVLVLIGIALVHQNNRSIKAHREQVFTSVSICQGSSPNFGHFSTAAEETGEVDAIRHPEFVAKTANLRKGMSVDEVRALLGNPTFGDAQLPKDGYEYWGCDWDYVLDAKVEDHTLTLLDHIQLSFDQSDRLKEWVRTDQYGRSISSKTK